MDAIFLDLKCFRGIACRFDLLQDRWWYIDLGIIFCQTTTASFSVFFKVWKMLFPEFALSLFRLCLWGNVEDEFWDEVRKGIIFEYSWFARDVIKF